MSNFHQNTDVAHDCITISPFDSPSGVTASMIILAPSHSDIASAKDGSTCSAVFQALVVRMPVLVLMASWHGILTY